ncbi:hypothetical protein B0H10DRAFT_2228867 [Mycena sp. CBHHK59/15]|nr:hypothetical protein B0H10DRAFT_2228867 [Mycena sp. CBHHK59/15]
MFGHAPPDDHDSPYKKVDKAKQQNKKFLLRTRRVLFALVCTSVGCVLGTWFAVHQEAPYAQQRDCVAHYDVPRPLFFDDPRVVTVTVPAPSPSAVSAPAEPPLLNGPPTAAFKDNLRPEVQYITTWPGSGWTNDVMLYMNLLYLALITERVPVIPYFTPTHVGGSAPTLAFGEVFDLPRLERALGKSVLEWHQVKDPQSESVDVLGCWTVWQAVQSGNAEPHFTSATNRLKLDVSYTTAPRWIKILPDNDGDPFAAFWALASLAFPERRTANLQAPALSPIYQVALPPDEHMLCYDYLYYVGASSIYEWESDYSPAWRFVGRYMYWTPKIEAIADSYVRRVLGTAPFEPTPPYIAVHVRHGDFRGWCSLPLEECFAPLSAIVRRVDEVQAELWQRRRATVEHVIVTSDEQDPEWWDAVHDLGWVGPDHTETVAVHGEWYPILIDAAIHSGALGFVGTDRSTVSLVAAKRVATWHGGAVRMVRWGEPGADDH